MINSLQSIEQSELLNQKESSPMIGFGLDYINVAKRPNMTLAIMEKIL